MMNPRSILPLAGAMAVSAFIPTELPAQAAPEEAKVVAEIAELKRLFDEGTHKNNERALAAIRAALASTKATYTFYMESHKKLEFDDAGKREADWREWRDRNEDRLKESGHVQARQLQLRFLALSVRAAEDGGSDKVLAGVMSELSSFLDDATAAAASLEGHRGVLERSVMSSTFARRMKLDLTIDTRGGWCFTPLNIDRIYDTTVLPYYRRTKNTTSLLAAWDRRILQEAKLATLNVSAAGVGDIAGLDRGEIEDLVSRFRGGRTGRERDRDQRREDERKSKLDVYDFRTDRLPELKWGKARDGLFFGSDRVTSLQAMTALVKENLNHEKAREWLDELTGLAAQKSYDPAAHYAK